MSKEFIKFFTVNARISDMQTDSPLDILMSCSQPKNLIRVSPVEWVIMNIMSQGAFLIIREQETCLSLVFLHLPS